MRKNQTFASPYFQHFQRKYPSKPVGQTPRNQRWRVAGEIPEHPRTSHGGLVHGENHGSQRGVFQPWSWFPEGGSEASPWGRMRAGELVESEQGLLSRWISGPGSFRKFDIQLDKVVCIYIYMCVCMTVCVWYFLLKPFFTFLFRGLPEMISSVAGDFDLSRNMILFWGFE